MDNKSIEDLITEMGINLSEEEINAIKKLSKNDGSDSESESDTDSEGSIQSLPELHTLEEVVLNRYTKFHPKDLIPSEEKLVALFLREFNDSFCDLENDYEDEQEEVDIIIEENQQQLKKMKKKKKNTKVNNIKKKIKDLEKKQKDEKQEFLKKKDALEKYYCLICINAIKRHPDPPGELTSILNLLEKNASTLHAICLHLNHFSYIDSDLEEDSDEELASMDGDLSGDEFPELPNLVQEIKNHSFSSEDSVIDCGEDKKFGSSSKAN